MKKRKLSVRPLYVSLYLCLVIDRIARPGAEASGVCAQVSVLAAVLQLLAVIIALCLLCRVQPRLSEVLTSGAFFKRMAGLLCLALFGASAGQTAAQAYLFLNLSVERRFSAAVFLALAILLACYAVHLGEQGIFRTGEVLAVLFAVAVVLIFLSNAKQAQLWNLRQSDAPLREISGTAIREFSVPVCLAAWGVLASARERQQKQRLWKTLTAACATGILFSIAGELVLGKMAAAESQPFYLLAKVGSLSVFQRLSPVYSFVFMLLLIQKLCFLLAAAQRSMQYSWDAPRWVLAISGLFSFCSAFFFLAQPAGTGRMAFTLGSLIVLLCEIPAEQEARHAA